MSAREQSPPRAPHPRDPGACYLYRSLALRTAGFYEGAITYYRYFGCYIYIRQTAGSALRFLRAVRFSPRQFLRYEPETSGIDVTLLRAYNDIPNKAISNWIMPN